LRDHKGELPFQARSPLPYTFAAQELQGPTAYVIYKVEGDPADHQFFSEPPKEIPHGYMCAYISDPLQVRFFLQSLIGLAFGWYTSLGFDSIRTWKQLEEQFHIQYHSEAAEAGIADLAQVRQKRGEIVAEYIQCLREVKNRCYSTRISEKEAVELASLGLVKPIKDLVFQLEFNSLAHLVQKLTSYEQRRLELYQDRFKR
jgi:hypothetical protein